MANDPLDLWPEGIRLNPLSPLAILKMQAARLGEKTRGLLTAEVLSGVEDAPADSPFTPSGKQVFHRFEVVAPQLNGYRYEMFVCQHDSELIYPVWVESDDAHDLSNGEEEAATQDEFVILVRKLLASKKHLGVITSLLARIAEAEATATPA